MKKYNVFRNGLVLEVIFLFIFSALTSIAFRKNNEETEEVKSYR